jgi:hypothetical protein
MNIELSKKYNLLVDTLIMACPTIGIISDDDIGDYLEELEGDYYTFFDHINLVDLHNAGVLNDLQMKNIVSLKQMIGNIPTSLWQIEAVKTDVYWTEVRQSANEILNSIGISRRKL